MTRRVRACPCAWGPHPACSSAPTANSRRVAQLLSQSVQAGCGWTLPHHTPLGPRARGGVLPGGFHDGLGPRAPREDDTTPPLAGSCLMARPRLELGTPRFSVIHCARPDLPGVSGFRRARPRSLRRPHRRPHGRTAIRARKTPPRARRARCVPSVIGHFQLMPSQRPGAVMARAPTWAPGRPSLGRRRSSSDSSADGVPGTPARQRARDACGARIKPVIRSRAPGKITLGTSSRHRGRERVRTRWRIQGGWRARAPGPPRQPLAEPACRYPGVHEDPPRGIATPPPTSLEPHADICMCPRRGHADPTPRRGAACL